MKPTSPFPLPFPSLTFMPSENLNTNHTTSAFVYTRVTTQKTKQKRDVRQLKVARASWPGFPVFVAQERIYLPWLIGIWPVDVGDVYRHYDEILRRRGELSDDLMGGEMSDVSGWR